MSRDIQITKETTLTIHTKDGSLMICMEQAKCLVHYLNDFLEGEGVTQPAKTPKGPQPGTMGVGFMEVTPPAGGMGRR